MIQPKIPVAKEGVPFIGFAAFLTIIAAIFGSCTFTTIFLLATIFILYFFRDPERFIPVDPNAVISPADGKVIVVDKIHDTRFTEGEAVKISIFMNVFNVHVNRSPMTGTVDKVLYSPGKFYSADTQKGGEYNEQCGIVMQTDSGKKIAFVQIAGLIARRIVCWLEPGDSIKKGSRFGLIRFGSRVDIYLPADTPVNVAVGQKVVAGESTLAHLE